VNVINVKGCLLSDPGQTAAFTASIRAWDNSPAQLFGNVHFLRGCSRRSPRLQSKIRQRFGKIDKPLSFTALLDSESSSGLLLGEQCRESLIHTRRQLETSEITGQVDVE
jgi:hypothetical protein